MAVEPLDLNSEVRLGFYSTGTSVAVAMYIIGAIEILIIYIVGPDVDIWAGYNELSNDFLTSKMLAW